ncbi:hypothetical protein TNIN_58161 [Trichonephila inaurata madagascariensis]|uniref:Uncharacterized protein n=1 Tax=Trichonephila inaurata madagascariensis TaxID=2747483 RepID=A0A8X6YUC7_9ARAC|nr:hypothetical protein TNIN_58161 [Trichonephila inaurata madagascariensis]
MGTTRHQISSLPFYGLRTSAKSGQARGSDTEWMRKSRDSILETSASLRYRKRNFNNTVLAYIAQKLHKQHYDPEIETSSKTPLRKTEYQLTFFWDT